MLAGEPSSFKKTIVIFRSEPNAILTRVYEILMNIFFHFIASCGTNQFQCNSGVCKNTVTGGTLKSDCCNSKTDKCIDLSEVGEWLLHHIKPHINNLLWVINSSLDTMLKYFTANIYKLLQLL